MLEAVRLGCPITHDVLECREKQAVITLCIAVTLQCIAAIMQCKGLEPKQDWRDLCTMQIMYLSVSQ